MKKAILTVAGITAIFLSSCSKEKMNTKELEDSNWKVTTYEFTQASNSQKIDMLQWNEITAHFSEGNKGTMVNVDKTDNSSETSNFTWDVSSDGKGVDITIEGDTEKRHFDFKEVKRDIESITYFNANDAIDMEGKSISGAMNMVFSKQ
jgi:hypothetical protein